MAKKGIIFTIDAIIAILAAITLTAGSFYYLSQTQNIQWTTADLFQISMNSLAVLELRNDLQNAVDSMSTTELDNYLNNILPVQVCADITIFNEAQSQILSTIKSGCTATAYNAVAIRSFYLNNNIYYAEMGVWYE